MMVLFGSSIRRVSSRGWREVYRVRAILLLNGLMSVGYTIIDVLV
jgi:hypothetical protein